MRPNLVRRETDQILSYYQSEYAGLSPDYEDDDGQQPAGLTRRGSHASNSSSQYSAESEHHSHPVTANTADNHPTESSATSTGHVRRPSVPSQESVDRRRLAIVEIDRDSFLPPSVGRSDSSRRGDSGASSSSRLLSRRGVHVNGLALVAPPDASPATYTDLTPPPTAPILSGGNQRSHSPRLAAFHTRSTSEATGSLSYLRHKTSRDVGIVGIGHIPSIAETSSHPSPPRETHELYTNSAGLQVPIFQTPTKSRSPSPAIDTPDLAGTSASSTGQSPYLSAWHYSSDSVRYQPSTPGIGEGKDIQQPVVGPVVVDLDSGKVFKRRPMQPMDINNTSVSHKISQGSSYTPYQPGLHTTASPLPVPPRTIFDVAATASVSVPTSPPPRPPRMRTPMLLPQSSAISQPSSDRRELEALKESLQLPVHVSTVLASRPDLRRTGTDVSYGSSHSDRTKEST